MTSSKLMLLSATLALAAISAASAQPLRSGGYRAMQPPPNGPESAYAQYPRGTRMPFVDRLDGAYDVQGNYIGSDPDPLVRQQLHEDNPSLY